MRLGNSISVGRSMWLDGLHSFYQGLNTHTIYSSFFGSLALGLISHYMARTKREPAIIFMVPGIIPLVPGGLAFDATKNLVLLDFSKAINTMLEVTLIAAPLRSAYYLQTKFLKLYYLVLQEHEKNITSFILLLIIESAWLLEPRF